MVAATGQLSQTLAQLRIRVADRLGDYYKLTATSNGTVNTFVDAINVNTASESPVGREIVLEDGTKRRVSSWTDTTGTLTWVTALSATTYVASGKTASLFNKRSKGFLSAEYDRAINNAIDDAYPLGMVRIVSTIGTAFDADTQTVTLPATLVYLTGLEWEDDDLFWHVVPPATRTSEYGWIADPASGQLRVLGGPAWEIDGQTLRVTGYGRQDNLTADTDTCLLDPEYVVSRACYHLTMGGLDRDSIYGQMVGIFLQESEKKRSRIRTMNKGALVRSY